MSCLSRASARGLPLWILVLVLSTAAGAQRKAASIASAWVRLPAAGATQAEAFLVVDNPTAYDVVLQKPASDAAGAVDIRAAGKAETLEYLTVPAYGALDIDGKAAYLLLRDLKKPLTEGATVSLSLMTDSGAPLTAQAVVKKD
jgi:copper(I)-binding protein